MVATVTRTIVLSGYYGFRNSGDEAVLRSILTALDAEGQRTGVSYEPIVLSADPEWTTRMYGVRAVPRMKIAEVRKAIRESHGLISGGGSLLQDATGPASIPYYLGIIKLAQWMRKPTFVYAQGVGPVNRKLFHPLIASVFKKCRYVSVRDIESAELLRSMGLRAEQVEVVPDPVMGMKLPEEMMEGSTALAKNGPLISQDELADGTGRMESNKPDESAKTTKPGNSSTGLGKQTAAEVGTDSALEQRGAEQSASGDDAAALSAEDAQPGSDSVGTNRAIGPVGSAGESIARTLNAAGSDAAAMAAGNTAHALNETAGNADAASGAVAPDVLPIIGISVRFWNSERSELAALSAGLADLARQHPVHLRFLPFHLPSDEEASRFCIERIGDLSAAGSQVSMAPATDNPQDMLREVDACSLLIGMRLHSLIYAASRSVPLLGISYDPKIDHFLARLGTVPVGTSDHLDPKSLAAQAQHLLVSGDEWRRKHSGQIDKLKREAQLPAQWITDFLNG